MRATLVTLLVAACGASPAPGGETAAERADPLLGAWWTGSAPDGGLLPCPLEVEVFEDGTAEFDFLNDDSEEKMCSFARVPVVRVAGDPPSVRFAGQLAACLWKREGPRLRLACEDHQHPPPDFSTSILLERRPVRARTGLEALVGRWSSAVFWSPAQELTIAPDGHVHFMGDSGRLSVESDTELAIEARGRVLRCRYRAIVDRLTLRCGAPGEPVPDGFRGGPILETLVLRRRGGASAQAPRFGPEAPHVAAGRDGDGDGVRDPRGGRGPHASLDASDRCPEQAEDYDGFEDEDGCPEPDNDRDGVLDVDDLCPLVAEDRDADADDDGCPEAARGDRDGDGTLDDLDRCPDDPEDRDGFEDEDGCPDPDDDRDGLLDVDDLCPNDPETRNGRADQDGCPDR